MKDVTKELSGARQGVPTEIYVLDGVSGMQEVFRDLGGNGMVTESDIQETTINRECAWSIGCITMARGGQQRDAEMPGLPPTRPSLKERQSDL